MIHPKMAQGVFKAFGWPVALIGGLIVALMVIGLTACNSVKWPVIPWTNAPAIFPTTTTTIQPTPAPTIPPTPQPARNLAGNYNPSLCNPTHQWPAFIFAYWETVDNGATGVSGIEVPKSAVWVRADGRREPSAQGGGWFYLPSADARTIAGPLALEITGRDGTIFRYQVNNPQQDKSDIMPMGG